MLRLLFAVIAVIGCSTAAPSAPPTAFFSDTILLPYLAPAPVGSGFVTGCAGIPFNAVLHGDPSDPRITWIDDLSDGRRREIIWPPGTAARFSPELEVISPSGEVVMREGDHVDGGCVTGDPNVFLIWPG